MASTQNFSSYEDLAIQTGISHADRPLTTPLSHGHFQFDSPTFVWTTPRTIFLALSLSLLPKALSSLGAWKAEATMGYYRQPAPVLYSTPVLGNLFMFLYAPQDLAKFMSQRLGKSGIFSLSMLTQEVYIVSGADYLNAIWKDTKKVIMSHDALNLSLSNMTGSSHDPDAQSPARNPDQRVPYVMLKNTAEYLSGGNLTATAQRYQTAMRSQLASVPVEDEWIEMDDLFSFARRVVANSTCETMLGAKFLAQFPDFVDNFYAYNSRIRRLLQGWPRLLIPRAWGARERCIEIMRQWRKTLNVEEFDGSPMMLKRWSIFEKWNISDDAIAAQDLGILWGYDPQLLAAATAEVDECRRKEADDGISLDTTKLTSQPVLQSMHAEALRKYVAIPKNKLLVINSAMAHMDERNWNLGIQGERPVDTFWGQRFLTQSTGPSAEASDIKSGLDQEKPTFSLHRYKGAWVPFGEGIHQCPARHWVKTQMLISLAMITGTFEIELLCSDKDLRVDLSKYGLGALNPGEKAPFRIYEKGHQYRNRIESQMDICIS
ncbi:MAG: hypothetical protein Q9226_001876 [Calogaya cf. arnoldii]